MSKTGVVARVVLASSAAAAAAFAVRINPAWHAYAPAVGWIMGAAVFLVWTWILLWRMDGTRTRQHAADDWDSTSVPAHTFVMVASLGSLIGVGYLLASRPNSEHPDLAASGVGALSVVASWLMIHTIFTLRYAHRYYDVANRPIEFNEHSGFLPTYHDFAYLAFTVGMTYQVSDTNIKSTAMRREVLAHALLSFLLGAVVLAITINLVASLAGGGG